MSQLQPDEDRCVELAIAGDSEAFGELYVRHLDAIYRYVYFRVGEKEDAEDLTEQVFLNAWEALPGYRRSGSPFSSWLYRIAHNIVVDYHRRRKACPPADTSVEVQLADDQASALGQVIASEEAATIAKALAQLPEEQQQVIILRFIEGLSHGEIARIMGKNEGACRMIQHRALAALSLLLRFVKE